MNVPFLNLKTQYEEVNDEILLKIEDIFKNCCFIGGKYVSEFEKEIADYLGVKHAIGCSNGTDALVLALKACNVLSGDEVITTSFSFFATAEAISSIGAIPVFVDIKKDDYTIDSSKIEEAITEKTKAILPVHIFGYTCDMDEIMSIARKHSLKVIEDDAQAIGSEYKGKKAGTLGDVGCFSFYPTKNLGGAGDGGMVTTNSDDLFVAISAYKNHGAGEMGAKTLEMQGGEAVVDDIKEKKSELYNPYMYYNYLIGYNSRLDAIQAAVLSVKLKHLDKYNNNRNRIAQQYMDRLTNKVNKPVYSNENKPCWHQFVICTEYKEQLCSYLSEHGVGNGTFYPVPLHKQKAFNMSNSRVGNQVMNISEEISSQSVCLPIFPEMTDEMIEYVIKTVNSFFEDK